MLEKFHRHIAENFSFLKDKKILLAISGGVDSVVLTHLCKAEKLDFALAHCNFNLRGKESDADAEFVKDLAKSLDVEVFVKSFATQTFSAQQKLSTQLAARKLRYAWFGELRTEKGFNSILTAHHLNDSIETFFINLLRGTGLDGLTGIPEKNGPVVRPLLVFTRKEILEYAKKHKLKWREDHSNATDDYLRNRIRHKIIPTLEKENPEFTGNFSLTQGHLKSSADLLHVYSSELQQKFMRKSDGNHHLDILKLKAHPQPKAVLFQLLKAYGFTAWDDIYDLLEAQSGKQVFSQTHRLIKNRQELILTEQPKTNQSTYRIFANSSILNFSKGQLVLKRVTKVTQKNNQIAYIPAEKLNFPLKLRLWEPGDIFQPFGMKGHKKLSDFLKDEKLSLLEKENTWVLTSNKTIVWVVGHRLDDNFRVEDDTKDILKIELLQ